MAKDRINVQFGGFDTGAWLTFTARGKPVAASSLFLNREEMMALAQAMYNVASRPQHVVVDKDDIFTGHQPVYANLEIKVGGDYRRYRGIRSPAVPKTLGSMEKL